MQAHQGFNKQSIISHLHCVKELPSPGHRQQLSIRWYLGHFAREFARPCLPPSTSCRSSSFSNSHWCSRMRLSPRGRQPAKFSSTRTYATEVSKIFLLLRCMPEIRESHFFFSPQKNPSLILAQKEWIIYTYDILGQLSLKIHGVLLIKMYSFCSKATVWTSFKTEFYIHR